MKIENVPLASGTRSKNEVSLSVFCDGVKSLQPGQSFVVADMKTIHRTALTIANHLLDRHFITRKDEGGIRVGCVS